MSRMAPLPVPIEIDGPNRTRLEWSVNRAGKPGAVRSLADEGLRQHLLSAHTTVASTSAYPVLSDYRLLLRGGTTPLSRRYTTRLP